MQQAGYSPAQLALITRSMRLTEGLLLICGPTNSGKSTTVTSLLHSEPETRCIIELADPIEAVLVNTTHVEHGPQRRRTPKASATASLKPRCGRTPTSCA